MMMIPKILILQILQLDTGSTVDPLYAGFSEEPAKGISWSIVFVMHCVILYFTVLYMYALCLFTCGSFLWMAGYRRGLGEGENAKEVWALVVLEKEQCEAGTETVWLRLQSLCNLMSHTSICVFTAEVSVILYCFSNFAL